MSAPTHQAIFLSYAHDDVAAARRIAEALRSSGLEVWFDESELRGGDTWDSKIRKQIADCALFVPLISSHTEARAKGYFRLEWKLAVEQTHLLAEGVPYIAPVAIDDTRETGAVVPAEFLRVQWTRLQGALPTTQFVEQIKRLLDSPSAPKSEMEPGRPRPGQRAEGGASPTNLSPPTKPRFPVALVAGLVTAVLALAGYIALRPATKETPPPAAPAKAVAENKILPTPAAPVANAKSAPADKSVAVLAFTNLSDDKDNEYFSDGISEELLNVLAKIPDLKVTARTSAFSFKGKNLSIPEIARQLGVAYVVEGSVRKSGARVRITAQLIKADGGFHVWSDNFDRELKDVFAIQSDVAERVAAALKVSVMGAEKSRAAKTPTTNMEAYAHYQIGRTWWNKRSKTGVEKAIQSFTQAIALDPAYAEAYAGLGVCYVIAPEYTGMPSKETMPKAQAAALKALELDPTLAEPHAVLAGVKGTVFDWSGAEQEYRRAFELNPNYATAHHWFANDLEARGRFNEALGEALRAAELDPLSLVIKAVVANCYRETGQPELAIQLGRKALELDPDFGLLHSNLGAHYLQKNSLPEALAELRKMRTLVPDSSFGLGLLGNALARSGDRAQAQAVLNELEGWRKQGLAVELELARVHLGLGETDQTLTALERAFENGEAPTDLAHGPLWQEVRSQPRAQALIRKMNLAK